MTPEKNKDGSPEAGSPTPSASQYEGAADDFTRCGGGACPLRETCERYNRPRVVGLNYWWIAPPYEAGQCSEFVPRREAPAEASDAEQSSPVTPGLPK